MAEFICVTCLRSLGPRKSNDKDECTACQLLRAKAEIEPRDIEFLNRALVRQMKKAVGYWPPRWARNGS